MRHDPRSRPLLPNEVHGCLPYAPFATCPPIPRDVVGSPRYAGPAVKLLFTMVTELPCENMRFEADLEAPGGYGGVGEGVGRTSSGGAAAAGSTSRSRRSESGASAGAAASSSEEGAATVRNADAVMVRPGIGVLLRRHPCSRGAFLAFAVGVVRWVVGGLRGALTAPSWWSSLVLADVHARLKEDAPASTCDCLDPSVEHIEYSRPSLVSASKEANPSYPTRSG